MTPEPLVVDLGLPSGLLWASRNVGATKKESFGLYFSWGNTEGHVAGAGYTFDSQSYIESPGYAVNSDITLEQDAARVNMGSPWRLPTEAEVQELLDNCTSVWSAINEVNGLLLTSNVNGKSIFLPAAGNGVNTAIDNRNVVGHYWTNKITSGTQAVSLGFDNTTVLLNANTNRILGFTIRAVCEA